MEKLQWRVKHKVDFTKEIDFLETILIESGVEDIKNFLSPKETHTHNPNLLNNIDEGIELLHKNLNKKIYLKVDPDVDGFTSAAYIRQFLQVLNPDVNLIYQLDYNKKHGVFYDDVKEYDDLSLIIVPDASMLVEDGKKIKEELNVPVLILDHHNIEDIDILNYATVINCTDGNYPNKNLSGVGVVHKFCLGYCEKHNINKELCNRFLDLVAFGMIADACDLRDLETRYYVLEGLKEYNRKNKLIKEMAETFAEDMKFGHTITNYGWVLAPKINATVRYGKKEEQIDLFRALCEENESIEYQPRRKSKDDPKPPIEIHSLQKTMARVCNNVKQRQDTEVRKFMEKIEKKIEEENLLQNSIVIIDGTDILTKSTVTGLVANKLTSKHKRPVVILKSFTDELFGGSGRGYDKGAIDNFREFLIDLNLFEKCAGHPSAFGVEIKKDRVPEVVAKCNERVKLEDLVTIHEVDYEVPINKLKEKDIMNVANSYQIWGNTVSEPLFAIINIEICASDIAAYGDNNGFIRFQVGGITFIKKYCPRGDYENMTLRERSTLGTNKKMLSMNIIGQFVLNEYEGKVTPQVKIKYFESNEWKSTKTIDIENDFIF